MRFFILLVLFSISSTITMAQSSELQVMSFNIRLPHEGDGFNYWDKRKDLVFSMIRYHEADVVGLQEAFRRQLDELKTHLPSYDWVGVCRTDGSRSPEPDNEFSAILYKTDRLELLEHNTFWLSKTPEKIGSVGWDAALPRIVTWAKFKDRITEKVFFHFNTHFDHKGEQARVESTKLLMQKVKEIASNHPTLITGDFNASDTSLPYRTIVDEKNEDRFTDALFASDMPHHGPLGTWTNSFQFPGVPGRRIDYVFIKNKVKVKKHAILSDSWSGRLPSDHLPVLAEVLIE